MKAEKNEKIKKISKNVSNLSNSFREYNIEGQETLQNFFEEEAVPMDKADHIVNQFKKLVHKALRNRKIDLYRKKKLLEEREIPYENPPCIDENAYDEYNFLENSIVVMNFKITIENDLLYELLNSLEQKHRDIIYLSLCENWSDMKISSELDMSRPKVQRIKQKIKKDIYEKLKGMVSKDD